ncbi:MAG: TIGR03752 family integrating conjugative element protein [Gammaproteobacteria bacterium]|nr:TIGR03752 family integrating conjugative element protein [Gammaproteobacteria bacterium]
MKRNRLVVFILVALSGGLILFGVKQCGRLPESEPPAETPIGTEDTAIETLSSLSAQFDAASKSLTRTLDDAMERLAVVEEKQAEDPGAAALLERVEEQVGEQMSAMTAGSASRLNAIESRLGKLGNALGDPDQEYAVGGRTPCVPRNDGRCWFTPAGAGIPVGGDRNRDGPGRAGPLLAGAHNLLDPNLNNDRLHQRPPSPAGSDESGWPVPVMTVPVNATLLDATAMTALIGRIPIRGAVRNPMPFKVITGADNLAANGIYIEGLEQAVWSGVAVGDGALKCVRGVLDSVTFVFRDGTIRTVQSPSSQNPGDLDDGLGWIADGKGFGCIPGKVVSNANEVLTRLFLASTASGYADALAQGEVTRTAEGGAVSSVLTGDPEDFALGRGVASGFREWADYVAERAQDVFDAVVVDPGQEIVLNISRQIEIDYDPAGRQVNHFVAGGVDDLD